MPAGTGCWFHTLASRRPLFHGRRYHHHSKSLVYCRPLFLRQRLDQRRHDRRRYRRHPRLHPGNNRLLHHMLGQTATTGRAPAHIQAHGGGPRNQPEPSARRAQMEAEKPNVRQPMEPGRESVDGRRLGQRNDGSRLLALLQQVRKSRIGTGHTESQADLGMAGSAGGGGTRCATAG